MLGVEGDWGRDASEVGSELKERGRIVYTDITYIQRYRIGYAIKLAINRKAADRQMDQGRTLEVHVR